MPTTTPLVTKTGLQVPKFNSAAVFLIGVPAIILLAGTSIGPVINLSLLAVIVYQFTKPAKG